MRKFISIIGLVALLVVMAISGTAVAYDDSAQASSYAELVPAPLGDLGDWPAPHFDELITSTGSPIPDDTESYMLYENWGGSWCDAEKVPYDDGGGNTPPDNPGDEDDLLCWAAAASNMLEWTGWGFVGTLDDTDDMFQYFQDHVTDYGSLLQYGLDWWFDGTLTTHPGDWSTEDVAGGGFWDPTYLYATYSAEYSGLDTMQAIDQYLHEGRAVGLGIWDGGHAITCWGIQYDPDFDKTTDPDRYYRGVWVTDSDNSKNLWSPPDTINYYGVELTHGYWLMCDYGCGWIIDQVTGLLPFPDTRPVADAGTSYTGSEGSAITFDGSGSSDADGDALYYRWDFDNDRVWDTPWSSSPTASHTWNDDYSGNVTLEVFDNRLRDVDTAAVTVYNAAPVVTVVGDTIDENGTATVSGTITDPSSLDSFTVVIDWGEGAPQSYNYPAGATTYSETHQYLDDNPTGTPSDDYTVTVTVTDDDMGVGNQTTAVTVNNVDPVVTGITMAQPNLQFILAAVHALNFTGTFTDVGTLDAHTAVWDWGDTLSSIGVVSESGGSGTVTGSHTYSAPGDYTVTLTVTDDDTGVHSNTYSVHVHDVDEALVITNNYIQDLDDSYFKGRADRRKASVDSTFHECADKWANEAYNGLIRDLRRSIREKADGYVDGKPNNDWITDATAQGEICQKIDDITAYLETLM